MTEPLTFMEAMAVLDRGGTLKRLADFSKYRLLADRSGAEYKTKKGSKWVGKNGRSIQFSVFVSGEFIEHIELVDGITALKAGVASPDKVLVRCEDWPNGCYLYPSSDRLMVFYPPPNQKWFEWSPDDLLKPNWTITRLDEHTEIEDA